MASFLLLGIENFCVLGVSKDGLRSRSTITGEPHVTGGKVGVSKDGLRSRSTMFWSVI